MNKPKAKLWFVWACLFLLFFTLSAVMHVVFHAWRHYDWQSLLFLDVGMATTYTFWYSVSLAKRKP